MWSAEVRLQELQSYRADAASKSQALPPPSDAAPSAAPSDAILPRPQDLASLAADVPFEEVVRTMPADVKESIRKQILERATRGTESMKLLVELVDQDAAEDEAIQLTLQALTESPTPSVREYVVMNAMVDNDVKDVPTLTQLLEQDALIKATPSLTDIVEESKVYEYLESKIDQENVEPYFEALMKDPNWSHPRIQDLYNVYMAHNVAVDISSASSAVDISPASSKAMTLASLADDPSIISSAMSMASLAMPKGAVDGSASVAASRASPLTPPSGSTMSMTSSGSPGILLPAGVPALGEAAPSPEDGNTEIDQVLLSPDVVRKVFRQPVGTREVSPDRVRSPQDPFGLVAVRTNQIYKDNEAEIDALCVNYGFPELDGNTLLWYTKALKLQEQLRNPRSTRALDMFQIIHKWVKKNLEVTPLVTALDTFLSAERYGNVAGEGIDLSGSFDNVADAVAVGFLSKVADAAASMTAVWQKKTNGTWTDLDPEFTRAIEHAIFSEDSVTFKDARAIGLKTDIPLVRTADKMEPLRRILKHSEVDAT